jgi:hypothetical protein
MHKNLLDEGDLIKISAESNPVTRDEIHARARELALIKGRVPGPPNVSQADYEQAKQELTGESDLSRQEAILDAIPDLNPSDPASSSIGYQLPESPNDDEGRSQSEQLAENGVEKAEHDQALQAAIETAKTNKGEP